MDALTLITFFICLSIFLSPHLERNRLWRATLTPLASIIGSGYLVSAPLLYYTLGSYAFLGMLLIVTFAYLIGGAIRYNILKAEGIIYGDEDFKHKGLLREMETFSNLSLSFAYMVSVAFYLRLLSSFIFSGFFERNNLYENLLTTFILAFVGVSGYLKGLSFLEFLERYAVGIKLSVIVSFFLALLLYNYPYVGFFQSPKGVNFETLRVLAGILLIVQGFETSKYLYQEYSPEERVRSMKLAQIFSALIYLSFIVTVTPLFYRLKIVKLDETSIIFVASSLSLILKYLIILGSLMSQFSAGVADTIGSGGLIEEETRGKVSSKLGYLLTSVVGIVLVWSANIFEIITYASKAFAFYYLLQGVIALTVSLSKREYKNSLTFSLTLLGLSFVVLFGESAE